MDRIHFVRLNIRNVEMATIFVADKQFWMTKGAMRRLSWFSHVKLDHQIEEPNGTDSNTR